MCMPVIGKLPLNDISVNHLRRIHNKARHVNGLNYICYVLLSTEKVTYDQSFYTTNDVVFEKLTKRGLVNATVTNSSTF